MDHHRALRQGYPEVIFGAGKTVEQIVEIAERIAARGDGVLAGQGQAGAEAATTAAGGAAALRAARGGSGANTPGLATAGAATDVVPDLMATPVFADLKMPVAAQAVPAAGGGNGSSSRPSLKPTTISAWRFLPALCSS